MQNSFSTPNAKALKHLTQELDDQDVPSPYPYSYTYLSRPSEEELASYLELARKFVERFKRDNALSDSKLSEDIKQLLANPPQHFDTKIRGTRLLAQSEEYFQRKEDLCTQGKAIVSFKYEYLWASKSKLLEFANEGIAYLKDHPYLYSDIVEAKVLERVPLLRNAADIDYMGIMWLEMYEQILAGKEPKTSQQAKEQDLNAFETWHAALQSLFKFLTEDEDGTEPWVKA